MSGSIKKICDQRRALWDRIDQQLTDEQRAYALTELENVCAARLEEEPHYAVTIMREIIFQLKRKRLNLPVDHNLALYLWSPLGGSGKSKFVEVLASPIRPLYAAVDAQDLLDTRHQEIWANSMLRVDEFSKLK